MKALRMFVVFFVFVLSSCCPDELCKCPRPELQINTSGSGYYITRVDTAYQEIDQIQIASSFALLNRDYFNYSPDEDIDDYNYIITNIYTYSIDTISNISSELEPYTFECVDCILKKDIMRCNNIINKSLLLNGGVMNDFSITLN